MSYCPFNGSEFGPNVCKGINCKLADIKGNCLVRKALDTFIETQEFELAVKKRELDEKLDALELQSKLLKFQTEQDKMLSQHVLSTPPLSDAPINYRKDWLT